MGRRLHEAARDQLLRRASSEGRPAGEHLVEHAAQRVDIAARIRLIARRLLGTHVRRSADAHARARESLADGRVQRARDAKVGDERMPGSEENVLRLDVAMDDAVLVRVGERARHLPCELDRIGDR